MPVSGNEEIVVKPLLLRHAIDYPAGIPIKKRRYPMIRPPSPPPLVEEPASNPVDTNLPLKDQSSPYGSPALSLSNVGTGSSGFLEPIKSAEPIKNAEPEERKERSYVEDSLGGNINPSEVKVEAPSLVRTGSLDKKEKSLIVENPVDDSVSGKSELNTVADVKVKVEAKKPEPQEKTRSLLSVEELFLPVLLNQKITSSDQNQGSSEPISLNLSLSKQSRNACQLKADDVNGSNVDSRLCEDRANWDLNTPMDTWVGPLSELALGQTSHGGTNAAAGPTKDLKPVVVVAPEKCSDILRKNLTSLSALSNLSGNKGNSEDSLHLRLSQFNGNGQSTPSDKLNADKIIPNAKLPIVIGSSSNLYKGNVSVVKAEPVDESIKPDAKGAETSNVTMVKRELVDQGRNEAPKSILQSIQIPVESRPVKTEPVLASNNQTINSKEGTSLHLNEYVEHGLDKQSSAVPAFTTSKTASSVVNSSCSIECERSQSSLLLKTAEDSSPSGSSLSTECKLRSAEATFKTTEIACPAVSSSVSIELARNESLLSSSDKPSFINRSRLKGHLEAGESSAQVAPGTCSTLTSVEADMAKAEDSITDTSEACKSNPPSDLPLPSRGNVVGSGSDEEKVNISAEIEVSCGSDYESDGNHAMDMSVDMEIDSGEDYEDGEVRESQELIAAKESADTLEAINDDNKNNLNTGTTSTLEVISDANMSTSQGEVHGVRTCIAEIGKDGDEASNAVHGDKHEMGSEEILHLETPTAIETPCGVGALVSETDEAVYRTPLDQSGKRSPQEYEERDSKKVVNGGVESLPIYSYGMSLSVNEDNMIPQNDATLLRAVTDVDDAAKDIDNGSHRSRIINLPRSSGSSSPSGTRAYPARIVQDRAGRSDVALEGDRIHSRGREDIYFDGSQKFSRERQHDQAPRNSRFNFMRGRGRMSNRHDNLRGDRESDREFASEYYNGPTEYRVPRHKFASSVSDDLEYNSYNVSQDVGFVGSGRGGRKPLNDGGQFVRRMPARRRSPGAPPRGTHMVRRISRNISPNRYVAEDGSEVVRPRRNVRGFTDDSVDPMFSHPQPSYETGDGHFAQGNRSFGSSQRRVMHRIRSKSPVGPRTRSPGAWSSPRRRSPDGFAGHPDLNQQRSPPFYRMERMKSPDRRCFPGDVVVRRQDMRDVDSGRDHGGHQGSSMPNNRSPSGRIVIRERRFVGQDPQERPEGDDFYGGPMSSGRLHELAGEANGDERRFNERRGPVRPYRNSFNGANSESFHLNTEDGSRPMRFGPDDNTEFQDRGSLVERDFNRRIKNRPVNGPRRMRNVEDQEVNYRHGNQVWNNNDYDEMARVKRKRY